MNNFDVDLKKYSILVVEDALEYKQLISEAMGRSSQHIYASTLQEAKDYVQSQQFDCIILDLSLPDGSGFDLLRAFPELETPVIIVTASNEIGSMVMGLSMGAQDYIAKPFDSMELLFRVKNKIDHFGKMSAKTIRKNIGNMVIDLSKRHVYLGDNEETIELTRKEFDCLVYFSENEDIVLTREQLLDKVWGSENFVLERSVDSAIVGLRKKVAHWDYRLSAVYGVGYKLCRKEKKKAKMAQQPSSKLQELFRTESEKQLKELEEMIYLSAWDDVHKIVHKLKGTFSIFTTALTEMGDAVEQGFRDGKDISVSSKDFLVRAMQERESILGQDIEQLAS